MKNTGYFRKKVTELVDEHGSTRATVVNFQAGINVSKVNSVEYNMIYSAAEHDLLQMGDQLLNEMLSNPAIINPSIEIKKTGSKPHIVAKYSMIEPKPL